jgi:hypothetical protein
MKRRQLRQLRLPLGINTLPSAQFREMLANAARQPRSNKYGAIRTTCEGIEFDSRREAARYLELRRLEDAGHIKELELQPRFDLVVNGVRCGAYFADFRYVEGGEEVIEDVKGGSATKTQLYRLKKKIVEALYGFKIRETM